MRTFVGETLDVMRVDHWRGPEGDGTRRGTIVVEIHGTPVRLSGTVTMRPGGPGTLEEVEGDLKAAVRCSAARSSGRPSRRCVRRCRRSRRSARSGWAELAVTPDAHAVVQGHWQAVVVHAGHESAPAVRDAVTPDLDGG